MLRAGAQVERMTKNQVLGEMAPHPARSVEAFAAKAGPAGVVPAREKRPRGERRAVREAAKARVRTPLPIDHASAGMRVRRVIVDARDVVFVKGILEASDGVAAVFAESGGELAIVAPESRAAELDEILADLASEIGCVNAEPVSGDARSGDARSSDARSSDALSSDALTSDGGSSLGAGSSIRLDGA